MCPAARTQAGSGALTAQLNVISGICGLAPQPMADEAMPLLMCTLGGRLAWVQAQRLDGAPIKGRASCADGVQADLLDGAQHSVSRTRRRGLVERSLDLCETGSGEIKADGGGG